MRRIRKREREKFCSLFELLVFFCRYWDCMYTIQDFYDATHVQVVEVVTPLVCTENARSGNTSNREKQWQHRSFTEVFIGMASSTVLTHWKLC